MGRAEGTTPRTQKQRLSGQNRNPMSRGQPCASQAEWGPGTKPGHRTESHMPKCFKFSQLSSAPAMAVRVHWEKYRALAPEGQTGPLLPHLRLRACHLISLCYLAFSCVKQGCHSVYLVVAALSVSKAKHLHAMRKLAVALLWRVVGTQGTQ